MTMKAPRDTPVEHDSADARLAAARRFLATVPVIADWVEQLAPHLGDSPDRRAQLCARLTAHADRIEACHVAAIVKHLTAAEIDGLAAFQSSPLGRAILRKQAMITAELIPVLTPLLREAVEDTLRGGTGAA